jgi:hypothetical protein
MLAGANAFEISDIQEDESEAALARRSDVTMLHWVENGWMEFSRSTATKTKCERLVSRRRRRTDSMTAMSLEYFSRGTSVLSVFVGLSFHDID